jgi:hypothetical protein
MSVPLPPESLVFPSMESTCLIGADGLDFISVNPLTRNMFLHKITSTNAGQLSPKHSLRYQTLKKLFSQHIEGILTKQELLLSIFKQCELDHMATKGIFNPLTDNITME